MSRRSLPLDTFASLVPGRSRDQPPRPSTRRRRVTASSTAALPAIVTECLCSAMRRGGAKTPPANTGGARLAEGFTPGTATGTTATGAGGAAAGGGRGRRRGTGGAARRGRRAHFEADERRARDRPRRANGEHVVGG